MLQLSDLTMSAPPETAGPPAYSENAGASQDAAAPAETQPKENVELELPKSAADGLIQKPFPRPLDTSKTPTPEPLNPDQQAKYDAVLKAVSEWETVPTTSEKNATTASISDDERMWLTRECLLRYLRATKWNVSEAIDRLQRTLTWRREYGMENLTADYISPENQTGKQIILGYDIHARPCLYLLPSKQNTERSERQIQHLVFMLERVIDLMVPDQETIALVVNYSDSKSGQNASVGQARQTLNILQNHYPERMGRALVINGKCRTSKYALSDQQADQLTQCRS